MSTITELSVWNKEAQRTYVSIALCFPREDRSTRATINSAIEAALARVVAERPAFGGQITLGGPGVSDQGKLYLRTSPKDEVRVECRTTSISLAKSYDTLRANKFPASFFTNKEWSINGNLENPGDTKPVLRVATQMLCGGFILFLYLHHSYGDGGCMNHFLNFLAEAMNSRHLPLPPAAKDWQSTCKLSLSTQTYHSSPLDRLLEICPEYTALPTSIPKKTITSLESPFPSESGVGKTYTISAAKLDEWREKQRIHGRRPSRYSLLAAITWVYTSRARRAVLGDKGSGPILFNPLDWSSPHRKLFPNEPTVRRFFGNTIVTPTLQGSWDDFCSHDTDILAVVEKIQNMNNEVDESFVLARTALLETGAHVRHVGITKEAGNPGCWGFNTWEFMGVEADFGEFGKPEAIRRVQGAWAGTAHGLILPKRQGAEGVEIVITIEKEALRYLDESLEFGEWVVATDSDM